MHEHVAQIIERLGEIGRRGRRSFEESDSGPRIAPAEGKDAQQMERRGMG